MRTHIIRGALVAFFGITGLFGSVASVQFDGWQASVETNSASARPFAICNESPRDNPLVKHCSSDSRRQLERQRQ